LHVSARDEAMLLYDYCYDDGMIMMIMMMMMIIMIMKE